MLLTRDSRQAARVRHLASQARDPAPHYEHSEVGYNYRLSNLLAAIGRAQLASLDEKIHRRRAVFDKYVKELGGRPGISFIPEPTYGTSNGWLTCLRVDPEMAGASRDSLLGRLRGVGIEARPLWKPMHEQVVWAKASTFGGGVAGRLFRSGLCLPSGSGLTVSEQDEVISTVLTGLP